MSVVLVFLAGSAGLAQNMCRTVTVSMVGVRASMAALDRASKIAGTMFSSAGIEVNWLMAPASPSGQECSGVIVIRMTTGERIASAAEALAYARPYANGGTQITVFWDRVRNVAGTRPHFQDSILSHVLVHEIAHVLQRTTRHSETGVMRAFWTDSDYLRMRDGPLPFTPLDVELMHHGLDQRAAMAAAR